MYTLLGASVLGFDLVRRDGGGAVASLLVEALGLTEAELPVLARSRPRGRLSVVQRSEVGHLPEHPFLVEVLGTMNRLVADGRVDEALRLVEAAPMAGLADLLRCLRLEILGWARELGDDGDDGGGPGAEAEAEAAADVVADALVAAYHAARLSRPLALQLVEPWASAQPELPVRDADLGPCHADVGALLERLAAVDEGGRTRLRAAADQVRGTGQWAPSMHSATWAVHLAGRVRQAACAQLLAVRALCDCETTVSQAASGTWNLVSGALQSAVVNDVLDDATRDLLLAPVLQALSSPT